MAIGTLRLKTPGHTSGDHECVTAAVETRAARDHSPGPVLAWALGTLLALAVLATLTLPLLASGWAEGWFWWIHAPVAALAFGTPAVLLIKREPTSRIGWLLGLVALLLVTADAFAAWAWLALVGRPASLSGGPTALWVASTLWLPGFLLLPTVALLLAPEGSLPGPQWRPVLWLSITAVGLATILNATAPYDTGPDADTMMPDQPATALNPMQSDLVQRWLGWSPLLLAAAVLACVAGLVVRRRRAHGRERRQLDVVGVGVAATLALVLAGFAVPRPWFLVVAALALTPYPVALGIAAARHRLWDLDIVVRRSVVYGVVAGAVVAAYVVAIVALGGALGSTTGAPLLATAVVGGGAAPLHARVQRAVDRRLFGDRADPAAALRRLAERWQAPMPTTAATDALNLMARDVATSLRIPYARIVTATG